MARPRSKRDFGIAAAIAIAAAVFVIALFPIIVSLVSTRNYQIFTERFTEGINSSHVSGTVMISRDGSIFRAPVSCASSVYRVLMDSGMGKTRKTIPEGSSVSITFQDRSVIEFRETEITEKSALRESGLFIRFTDPDGYSYQYDTDKLTIDSVLSVLPDVP